MNMSRVAVPASVGALLSEARPLFGIHAQVDAVVEQFNVRRLDLIEANQNILALADGEKRDLTVEEQKEIDANASEVDRIVGQIARRQQVSAQAAALNERPGRQTDADAGDVEPDEQRPNASAPKPAVRPAALQPIVHARPRAGGNGGFRSFGDFAQSVFQASRRGGYVDDRLKNAAPSVIATEGTGADGGFAVPPDYRSEIMSLVFSEERLISRTDIIRTASNTVTVPIDETTPWQTTGGVQSYWVAEAATKPQSKVSLGNVTVKAHTLATLIPVTEELLEDAPAMDSYLRRKVPEKMDFAISYAMAWGNGAGKPLGWMNSPALVTVAAEGAQTADTINATNIVKMMGRMPATSRGSAIWIIHPDAETQLPLMTIGQQPVYMPQGGLSGAQYGTLLGRPVITSQIAETVGDLGDIMLVDPKQYMSVLKTGGGRDANGMRTDVSIHLWFDQDIVAYRFTVRVGGQPWWSQPIASRDGSNTMSPFITLAAR